MIKNMIPYFQLTEFYIGPVRIYTWGLMVALGVMLGTWMAVREARRRNLDAEKLANAAFWIIVWGFIGARLGHVFLYEFAFYREDFIEIVKVWHGGFSSYGGFIGAILAGIWQLRDAREKILAYADCGAWGLSVGWSIGRIGCFLIHDHPGTLTDFFLAVRQPDGTSRHDLGLYDGLLTFAIFLIFIVVRKKTLQNGTLAVIFIFIYSIVRFFLDFLRAVDIPNADIRYFGFTPAQYASIIALFFVIYFIFYFYRRERVKK